MCAGSTCHRIHTLYCTSLFSAAQFFQGAMSRTCVVPNGQDAVRFNISSPGFNDAMARLRTSLDDAPENYTVYDIGFPCSFESAFGVLCSCVS